MLSRDIAWSNIQKRYTKEIPAEKIKHDPTFFIFNKPFDLTTKVKVVRDDSISAGLKYPDPLILIFADDVTPGGTLVSGAQEEMIFYRTSVRQNLVKSLYPILSDECLYAPDVHVVYDTEANKYAEMPPNTRASFIACPGIKFPSTDRLNRLCPEDAALMKRKIELIIHVAVAKKHRTLVLGPLGTGAYGGPAQHIAEIFKEAVTEFAIGRVENVIFACLGSVYNVFSDVITS